MINDADFASSDVYSEIGAAYDSSGWKTQSRSYSSIGIACQKYTTLNENANTFSFVVHGFTLTVGYFNEISKARIFNLTEKGALDPARAAYYTAKYGYSVTKWEELEEDDLAAELPYVDGVACIGWDWSSGDKTITIENRGKNIAPSLIKDKVWSRERLVTHIGGTAFSEFVAVKPNTNYYLSKNGANALYSNVLFYNANKIYISEVYGVGAFTTPSSCKYLTAHTTLSSASVNDKIQLEEGDTATAYEPPRTDKIEIPVGTHLFGYAGVHEDMELQTGVKNAKWDFEDSIVISSGSGTLTKSGTGTALLIDENGVPYEGTVSGTSLSTSAPDGTYTVWYQLATPETEQVQLYYEDSQGMKHYPSDPKELLKIYPGQNNTIIPELASLEVKYNPRYI